jgi:hypothetical protein
VLQILADGVRHRRRLIKNRILKPRGLWHLYRRDSEKVKVKIKLSLCLTKHHAMKAYWGVAG